MSKEKEAAAVSEETTRPVTASEEPTLPADDGSGPAEGQGELAEDQWVFLIDPAWRPSGEDEAETPPGEAVVGGWFVAADGTTSRFHANPDYEPSGPDSPTDPVDATMQLVSKGDIEAEKLLSAMAEAVFEVAIDADGNPIVAPAPDDVPSLLVTTAPAHHRWVEGVSGWQEVSATDLAEVLPDEGIDLLLNPGAPTSMRILAGALKRAVAEFAPNTDQ